ncbi:unnamed protein product [Caenorhabditis angaria]|uniref:Uncharacterized protein n=1 Tax=Caenorhabditis angaria TaxID=860376 RepID=A0A9P1I3P5_9PELO|nr:unnamed protein product [Caenorhabditis angaria]
MLKVDFQKYRQELELWWPYQIFAFLIRHWIAILITIVVLIILKATFNNLIFPTYYESFKKAFGFEKTLANTKKILEADYEDLWHESEFCLAFLAVT